MADLEGFGEKGNRISIKTPPQKPRPSARSNGIIGFEVFR